MVSRRRAKLVRRLARRKGRERESLFVVEGIRLAEAALDAGAAVDFAVVSPRLREGSRGRELAAGLEEAGIPLEPASDEELAGLADTETPQGVVLVCPLPEHDLDDLDAGDPGGDSGPGPAVIVVFDAVQDPGNLGTLVRSAAAFGARGCVALPGTVDPWNPKAVRASAGALFRLPVVRAGWVEVREWLDEAGFRVVVSDAGGIPADGGTDAGPSALVVGNEGAGVRDEIAAAADAVVSVPMRGALDSLNVAMAGSILLYTLTRARGAR